MRKNFVGVVLMDLSKVFDSIPHDLLIYSYFKRRDQNVRINNTHSVFQVILSGVPQGSILDPLLFNIFIKDLYLWITKTDRLNFVDDSTMTAAEITIENLISTLEVESQAAIQWFKLNEMTVNPEEFQAILVNKNAEIKDSYPLNINDLTINCENSIKLLDIEIDISYPLSNTFLPSVIKQATN